MIPHFWKPIKQVQQIFTTTFNADKHIVSEYSTEEETLWLEAKTKLLPRSLATQTRFLRGGRGRGRGGKGEDGMRFTLNIFTFLYVDQAILWRTAMVLPFKWNVFGRTFLIVLFISLVLIHCCLLGSFEEGNRYCYVTTYSVWIWAQLNLRLKNLPRSPEYCLSLTDTRNHLQWQKHNYWQAYM